MADLYLTPAERYTAALGGFYYGDLPEPGTVYTQLIKDILNGSTPDKEPKNILARFIYSLYISDLGDPYPRYELAKLLYWKLHDITPTKSGSVLTVTIDGEEDYMTINTDLSRLWYKVLFGSKTDVITEFPYIFNTMQNKLSDWELFGNTVQSGTPTPDSPIMPQGTGDKTANLFDGYIEVGGLNANTGAETEQTDRRRSDFIEIEDNTNYNLSRTMTATTSNLWALFYDENKDYISGSNKGTTDANFTVLSPANAKYLRWYVTANGSYDNMMIVEGATAPPEYIPWGYKIPISSASTTTPVYLGEVESTRLIRELVLTGEEDWILSYGSFRINVPDYYRQSGWIPICTHYQGIDSVTGGGDLANGQVAFLVSASANYYAYICDTNYTSAADFKSYLAAQYAAGTPVCIWYVLANETTGIVNEPLMKIGDYADSMSRAQTGIDIPTVIGQNTLDVLTTVKPSSMSIEYTSADENRSRSKRISLLKSPLKKGLIK